MAFQSLYRRFRPRRFAEVIGQDHLITAVRNAVAEGRVGHAYLFSGPRGTGKTTTARILAKALNCENVSDGEPCGECESCVAIDAGRSLDLVELDAASHRGIDDVKALVQSVAIATPGMTKVYILDEVHALTRDASNALLKTLEEPPGHVVFVLATTDPQKVLPTIRSRTQHFELSLIGAELLSDHVRQVAERADIEVDDETVEYVVRRGAGSVRDALSALDQVFAAGGVGADDVPVDDVIDAIAASETKAALGAVAAAVSAGVDVRDLAESVARRLRDAFLVTMKVEPGQLPEQERERLAEQGRALGAATAVRAMEQIGAALIDMRQAPDPRLTLEAVLVRLTHPEVSSDLAALTQRVERLERGAARSAPPPDDSSDTPVPPPPPPPSSDGNPAAGARAALTDEAASGLEAQGHTDVPVSLETTPTQSDGGPDRDRLTLDWADKVLPKLPKKAKVLYEVGRWVTADAANGTAVFELPNDVHRGRCELERSHVEAELLRLYDRSITLQLVTPGQAIPEPPAPEPIDEPVDLTALTDAPPDDQTPLEKLTSAFPGAELVDD